jgi:hypothetical protein
MMEAVSHSGNKHSSYGPEEVNKRSAIKFSRHVYYFCKFYCLEIYKASLIDRFLFKSLPFMSIMSAKANLHKCALNVKLPECKVYFPCIHHITYILLRLEVYRVKKTCT